jgi:hypothetical protein
MPLSNLQQPEDLKFVPMDVDLEESGTPTLADAAAAAYNPMDSAYAQVFQQRASSDRFKSDAQLNSELILAPMTITDSMREGGFCGCKKTEWYSRRTQWCQQCCSGAKQDAAYSVGRLN